MKDKKKPKAELIQREAQSIALSDEIRKEIHGAIKELLPEIIRAELSKALGKEVRREMEHPEWDRARLAKKGGVPVVRRDAFIFDQTQRTREE